MVIEDEDLTEEKLMDDCLEAGAEDFSYTDGAAEITTVRKILMQSVTH